MRRLLLLLLALVPWFAKADTIPLTLIVQRADTMVASLSWNCANPSQNASYQVFRCCPDQQEFSLLATTPSTHYLDTIRRIVCGDTVFYQVFATTPTSHYRSAIEGDYFDDLWHTTGCTLHLATVVDQQIHLSWLPSPDADIMGYYLCKGSPCLDYDTVFGRLNTSYICHNLAVTEAHTFRILAFDSCFKASPLTDAYNNLVLQIDGSSCSRHITASWNDYQQMPQGLAGYTLFYANSGSNHYQPLTYIAANEPHLFQWDVPDSLFHLQFKVVAENLDGTLQAHSNAVQLHISVADTAQYLNILSAAHSPLTGCIELSFQVDAAYHAPHYTLYRQVGNTQWHAIATLPYQGEEYLSYTDCDLPFADVECRYKLSTIDSCGTYHQYSNTVAVMLPKAAESTLFLPNVFRPDDPNNAIFSPIGSYISLENYSLTIYNRMGLQVFHTTTLTTGWDGTHLGKAVPQGIYVYHLHYQFNNNRQYAQTGTLLLLR